MFIVLTILLGRTFSCNIHVDVAYTLMSYLMRQSCYIGYTGDWSLTVCSSAVCLSVFVIIQKQSAKTCRLYNENTVGSLASTLANLTLSSLSSLSSSSSSRSHLGPSRRSTMAPYRMACLQRLAEKDPVSLRSWSVQRARGRPGCYQVN